MNEVCTLAGVLVFMSAMKICAISTSYVAS